MKKLEIIIRSEKLETVKNILNNFGISDMMVTNIMGFGNQKGITQFYRGTEFTANFVPKLKIEIVVENTQAQLVIDEICKLVTTGTHGDGKIFVYDEKSLHALN